MTSHVVPLTDPGGQFNVIILPRSGGVVGATLTRAEAIELRDALTEALGGG